MRRLGNLASGAFGFAQRGIDILCRVDDVGQREAPKTDAVSSHAGIPGARFQSQAYLFWLVAAPVCYLLCALWYYRRAQRQGLAPRWHSYVGVGLALFVFISVVDLVPARSLNLLPAGGTTGEVGLEAGLTPLVAVALGLLVLGWTERSWLVAVVGLVFGGLTTVINTYGLGDIPPWVSEHGGAAKPYFVAPAHNLVVLATLPLGAAAWTGLRAWRARQS